MYTPVLPATACAPVGVTVPTEVTLAATVGASSLLVRGATTWQAAALPPTVNRGLDKVKNTTGVRPCAAADVMATERRLSPRVTPAAVAAACWLALVHTGG